MDAAAGGQTISRGGLMSGNLDCWRKTRGGFGLGRIARRDWRAQSGEHIFHRYLRVSVLSTGAEQSRWQGSVAWRSGPARRESTVGRVESGGRVRRQNARWPLRCASARGFMLNDPRRPRSPHSSPGNLSRWRIAIIRFYYEIYYHR